MLKSDTTGVIQVSSGHTMPTTSQPAVKIVDLRKGFDSRVRSIHSSIEVRNFLSIIMGRRDSKVQALDGVNLEIPSGVVFGLLGPNGAGKTTLIKVLSTLILPDSGRATVEGYDVVKSPRAVLQRLQAVLAEGFGFERRLTGRQNLEFYSTLYGLPRAEARAKIDEVLGLSGMTDFADDAFQKYSTGMARKLLVCRALLTNASVLLFDEPTAGLDPNAAAEFRRFLKDVVVKERKKTILWTTHNLWEAQMMCDRIAVLDHGRIISEGSPAEIRRRIAERVTITLTLASSIDRVNEVLEAKLRSIDGVVTVDASEGSEDGSVIVSMEGTRDLDYNAVIDLLSSTRVKVIGMEATQPTLEEAFMKLTQRQR